MSYIDRLTRGAVREALHYIKNDLEKESKRLILKPPKTGRLYRIAGRRRRHRASAPGEAPANLTGRLRRSVKGQQRSWDQLYFGATAPYAKYLELGTRKIRPRPYLIKSIENNERNMREHFQRELWQSLGML